MKSERSCLLLSSLWISLATLALMHLYSSESIDYWYVYFPIYLIVYYFILKNNYIKDKTKSAIVTDFSFGIVILYFSILYYISKDSFRENFFAYSLVFLVLLIGFIFLYRNYYFHKGMKI